MAIADTLQAINSAVQDAKAAITNKGGVVGDTGVSGLSSEIESIPTGGGWSGQEYNITDRTAADAYNDNTFSPISDISEFGNISTFVYKNTGLLNAVSLVAVSVDFTDTPTKKSALSLPTLTPTGTILNDDYSSCRLNSSTIGVFATSVELKKDLSTYTTTYTTYIYALPVTIAADGTLSCSTNWLLIKTIDNDDAGKYTPANVRNIVDNYVVMNKHYLYLVKYSGGSFSVITSSIVKDQFKADLRASILRQKSPTLYSLYYLGHWCSSMEKIDIDISSDTISQDTNFTFTNSYPDSKIFFNVGRPLETYDADKYILTGGISNSQLSTTDIIDSSVAIIEFDDDNNSATMGTSLTISQHQYSIYHLFAQTKGNTMAVLSAQAASVSFLARDISEAMPKLMAIEYTDSGFSIIKSNLLLPATTSSTDFSLIRPSMAFYSKQTYDVMNDFYVARGVDFIN